MRYLLFGTFSLLLMAGVSTAADTGQSLYVSKCVKCHGEKGEGKAAIEKLEKVKLKHLGSPEIQARSDKDLEDQSVWKGLGKMKPVPGLTKAQAVEIVKYVRTLKQ